MQPLTHVVTEWLPRVEVLPVVARKLPEVEVAMERLAELATPTEAETALLPLVKAYPAWFASQLACGSAGRRPPTRWRRSRRR